MNGTNIPKMDLEELKKIKKVECKFKVKEGSGTLYCETEWRDGKKTEFDFNIEDFLAKD